MQSADLAIDDELAELSPWATCSDPHEIARGLRDWERGLPTDLLRAAQRNCRAMVPALVELIRENVSRAAAGEEMNDPSTLFAVGLLTEFGDVSALPAVIELATQDDNLVYRLLGDGGSELLPHTLAVLGGEQTELLRGIIDDPKVGNSSRWSVIDALFLLYRDGKFPRDVLADCLRTAFLNVTTVDGYSDIDRDMVAWRLCDFALPVADAELRQAAENKALVESYYDWSIMAAMSAGQRATRHERYLQELAPTAILDVVNYFSDWAGFREGDVQRGGRFKLPSDLIERFADLVGRSVIEINRLNRKPISRDSLASDVVPSPTPENLSSVGKVGRNATCLCGSGKKFKKCCGGR